jgi:hypothetical protein
MKLIPDQNTANPAGSPAVRPKEVGDAAASGEFSKFEALTRKLVNVSKDELDEKRKDDS